MCSPAQLRQQTEELCAVIDQVLQDPLTMVTHHYVEWTYSFPFVSYHSYVYYLLKIFFQRRCESSPSFLQMSTESDVGKVGE